MTDIEIPEDEEQDFEERPRAPIEFRDAGVDHVDFSQRIITVVAVPYETPAKVMYRGQEWNEIFERSAFDNIEKKHRTIRANRGHSRERTVGKIVRFDRQRNEGLVTEVRIARTPLGDETLALADDDCLSASVGYGVLPKNFHLDRSNMIRRISKAFLDHLAFVEDPAYSDARVLQVRNDDPVPDPGPLVTPALDQFTDDEILRWAAQRLGRG